MSAKRRQKRGMFDPDYRTKRWRNSQYAPKNSESSITQTALMYASLFVLPIYALPFILQLAWLKPILWSPMGLSVGIGVSIGLWLVIGIHLRNREYKRLLQEEADIVRAKQAKQEEENRQRLTRIKKQDKITPRDFEHEVAWVFNTLTPYKAIVSGGAGDGGIDIKVMKGTALRSVVQCKKYDPKRALPPQYVRELSAVKQQHHVSSAYLVTTAYFTPATEKEAEKYGIKLIDGAKFLTMRKRAIEKTRGG